MSTPKKLFRSEKDRVLAGVCAGLAEYLNIDVPVIRVIFLLGFVFGFTSSFWVYLILWVVVPTESNAKQETREVLKENVEEIKAKAKEVVKEVKEVIKGKEKMTENKEQSSSK